MASGAAVALRQRVYAVADWRAPAMAAKARPAAMPAITPRATSARQRRRSSERAHRRTAAPAPPSFPTARFWPKAHRTAPRKAPQFAGVEPPPAISPSAFHALLEGGDALLVGGQEEVGHGVRRHVDGPVHVRPAAVGRDRDGRLVVLDGHGAGADAVDEDACIVVLALQRLGDLHAHHRQDPVVTLHPARLHRRQPVAQTPEVADDGPHLLGRAVDVDIGLCVSHGRELWPSPPPGTNFEGPNSNCGGDGYGSRRTFAYRRGARPRPGR